MRSWLVEVGWGFHNDDTYMTPKGSPGFSPARVKTYSHCCGQVGFDILCYSTPHSFVLPRYSGNGNLPEKATSLEMTSVGSDTFWDAEVLVIHTSYFSFGSRPVST